MVSGSVHNFVDDCILSKNSKRKFQKDISYFHVDTPRVSMICDLITTASSPKFLSPVSHPAQAQWAVQWVGGCENVRM